MMFNGVSKKKNVIVILNEMFSETLRVKWHSKSLRFKSNIPNCKV